MDPLKKMKAEAAKKARERATPPPQMASEGNGVQKLQRGELERVLSEGVLKEMRLGDLIPAEYNPRVISVEAKEALSASITTFGILGPPVFNKRSGRLIAGHQRVKALYDLGATADDKVWVIVVDFDELTEKACNIELNNPHVTGTFDAPALKLVLDELLAKDMPDLVYDSLAYPALEALAVPVMSKIPSDFDPVPEDTQPRLDEKQPITCPNCDHEFIPPSSLASRRSRKI